MNSTASSTSDFASMAYASRQLVVVLPDEVVAEARKAEAAAAHSADPIDWKSVATSVVKVMTSSLVGTLVDVTSEALTAWARARQGGLNVLQVGRSEAAGLKFPPGHPRDGVMYVGHPAEPSVYYTVASFHRMAFEHKFAEAIDLLMHLGATEIKVEHVRGWSREFAGRLSVSIPEKEASAEAKATSSQGAGLLYEATLKGSRQSSLPETLVWYHHEPTWQSVAKGRMSFGLKQFSLTVNYEDDFGVNAGLRGSAMKAGLELGGSFEDHEATTWKLHGKFGDDGELRDVPSSRSDAGRE